MADDRRRVWVDTDVGVDDAIALIVLMKGAGNIDGVSVVCGNAPVKIAATGAHIVIHHCIEASGSKLSQHPTIHMGAEVPLVHDSNLPKSWPGHGNDGLGNYTHREDAWSPSLGEYDPKPAAVALVDWARKLEAENQVGEIVALGPLTNLALACRLDPQFARRVRLIRFMGGTSRGRGNATPMAEFNVRYDPEAAHIVMHAFSGKFQMFSWELTLEAGFTNAWYERVIQQGSGTLTEFARNILGPFWIVTRQTSPHLRPEDRDVVLCDVVAAAAFVDPHVVSFEKSAAVDVILNPGFSRGALAVDWDFCHLPSGSPKISIVESLDQDVLEKLVEESFKY